jgi:DNA-binding transcriptional ArsR family regulator
VELEDVFCSKLRMKILKLLFQLMQLKTADFQKKLEASYTITMQHLTVLEKDGVITQRLSGRTRFFRFANTLKAQAVQKLLEEWD